MARTKKQSFKLDPEWMLKKPVDFEFNKYTLLDYLQKCESRFNNLEIYPDFFLFLLFCQPRLRVTSSIQVFKVNLESIILSLVIL